MQLYVICPKTSTNEEVAKEFSQDYGHDNVDLDHVQDVDSDKTRIEKHFMDYQQDPDKKDKYEIRRLTVNCSTLD